MDNSKNDYRLGTLPGTMAPLAMAYTPMQKSVDTAYESNEALSRGTLFPGLDLPFMNIVNKNLEATPMTELMAIDFVAHELGLYLDTHKDDKQAFEMYQTFLALAKEAHDRYIRKFGPVLKRDMLGMESYTWLDSPWPWDYQPKMEV